MKGLKYYITIIALLCTGLVCAQTDVDRMFEEASMLNDKKEFAQAANAFLRLQELALESGCYKTYILSITAEGECYYMLDLATNLKQVIDKACNAYEIYADRLDEMARLSLCEAIYKLTGAYYYCILDSYPNVAQEAENAYRNCLNLLDNLRNMPGSYFDDFEAEVIVHRELLGLYYKQKLYEKALEESDIVYYYWMDMGYDNGDTSAKGRSDYYSFIDACVSRAMILARLGAFDDANAIMNELPDECNGELSVLRTKGKIAVLQYDGDNDDELKKAKGYYSLYLQKMKQELKRQLAVLDSEKQEQFWLAMHDFLYDCYSLGECASEMLYNEALFSKGYLLEYKRNRSAVQYSWQDIRRALGNKECAIEFVQYKNKDDEKHLAALVVKKESRRPHFVDIAPVSEITSGKLCNGVSVNEAITGDKGVVKDILYTDTVLRDKIWNEELVSLTGGCDKLYFAPDGFLHQLAIEYMYPDTAVSLRRLSSTRALLDKSPLRVERMLLCGGIDYNADVVASKSDNDTLGFYNLKQTPTYINYLAGTKDEVETIHSLRNGGGRDTLLFGEEATDERFAELASSGYSAVHLATHGFFAGENDFSDLKPLYRDNAMSESGLIMAGAGNNLNNKDFIPIFSDGIVTAKELSSIDLSKVDLLVLSACQTGLGYVTADGVYGIRRAVKMAGAKAMIVSLWSVDDTATAEFMKMFYDELEKDSSPTPDIYRAFNAARRSMANIGGVVRRFDPASLTTKEQAKSIGNPQYSNAFILIDVL